MPETIFYRKELTKCIVRFVCDKTPKYFKQDGLTEHVLRGCNAIQNMDYLQSLILMKELCGFYYIKWILKQESISISIHTTSERILILLDPAGKWGVWFVILTKQIKIWQTHGPVPGRWEWSGELNWRRIWKTELEALIVVKPAAPL